ncbi:uncharacterized protein CYBJADRAFT_5839 [Cyberlindnera jadinii NRRL Y-1542]|uniref:Uncharacterized protein n=1 Tax=Cyberlindnera jadinii (strain ATCC 18201 / CBS 1600 / BCRC 20928 / JCM 3617 / NBRC 0987 / NRRL Y-1542) TaxID=983966 RepID=A0A1E4S938_CYBJN|nr:hypothetical protein CYBJADRAFT_5839 [Cyberlindnera jadinii NRRL Y-1542]ODV76010.1 hypothetical protein CYBJADRAFT_5839 [Cyberlindnera jadinii NRRL Y-1542]
MAQYYRASPAEPVACVAPLPPQPACLCSTVLSLWIIAITTVVCTGFVTRRSFRACVRVRVRVMVSALEFSQLLPKTFPWPLLRSLRNADSPVEGGITEQTFLSSCCKRARLTREEAICR